MSKKKIFDVSEIGALGKKIFNDIGKNILDLKAVKGKISIEINLEVEDENVFKDDQTRKAILKIEIDLKENKSAI